jgi:hypothetical protein
VKDGTRTRGRQGHNLELYHLSYLHHRAATVARGGRQGYHRRSATVIIRSLPQENVSRAAEPRVVARAPLCDTAALPAANVGTDACGGPAAGVWTLCHRAGL